VLALRYIHGQRFLAEHMPASPEQMTDDVEMRLGRGDDADGGDRFGDQVDVGDHLRAAKVRRLARSRFIAIHARGDAHAVHLLKGFDMRLADSAATNHGNVQRPVHTFYGKHLAWRRNRAGVGIDQNPVVYAMRRCGRFV